MAIRLAGRTKATNGNTTPRISTKSIDPDPRRLRSVNFGVGRMGRRIGKFSVPWEPEPAPVYRSSRFCEETSTAVSEIRCLRVHSLYGGPCKSHRNCSAIRRDQTQRPRIDPEYHGRNPRTGHGATSRGVSGRVIASRSACPSFSVPFRVRPWLARILHNPISGGPPIGECTPVHACASEKSTASKVRSLCHTDSLGIRRYSVLTLHEKAQGLRPLGFRHVFASGPGLSTGFRRLRNPLRAHRLRLREVGHPGLGRSTRRSP